MNYRRDEGHGGGALEIHTIFNILTQHMGLTWYY